MERPTVVDVPRRSWVMVTVVAGVMAAQGLFLTAVASPNTGLLEYMGFSNSSQFEAQVPATADFAQATLRLAGLWSAGFALLALTISVVAYRRGQLWAWSVLWVVPLVNVLGFLSDRAVFADAPSDTGTLGPLFVAFAVVAGVGLLLGLPAVRSVRGTISAHAAVSV